MLMCPGDSPVFSRAEEEGLDVHALSIARYPSWARQADIVHAHDARTHTIAALFPQGPIVVARRVAFAIHTGGLSRVKYRRAAHYIAVSNYVANVLRSAGVPDAKISVVYDGVPLLESMQPRTIPLLMLDKGTGLGVEGARAAQNLEAELPAAKTFLYLTHCEGLGSAVLLAMSAGAAVVASNIGGIPEAITPDRDGLLVKNSAPAIAAALQRLAGDPELGQRLAAHARHTVEERFAEQQMVDNTLKIYEKVLDA
jgi:glycosyltransferase involved in cell wall biosynthesis